MTTYIKGHWRRKLLPACPHFCWQIHLSCLWSMPLLVLKLASLGFQFRPKINNSLELPWDSSIRWELLRNPVLWNEQLPGHCHWLFCQETFIVGFFSDYSLYPTSRTLLLIYMEYGGLNGNDPHRFIYLNTLFPVDWEGLGGVALLEELYHCGWIVRLNILKLFPVSLSFCLMTVSQDVSFQLSFQSLACLPACLLPWGSNKCFLV